MLSAWKLRMACRVLKAEGVLAYPTEAVYGLGCDPWSGRAVARLLQAKGRSAGKGLILVAADVAQLAPFVDWSRIGAERRTAIVATWPGPVTWVLPALPEVPQWLRGNHEAIAVRVSGHSLVQELCSSFGAALVSTSANRSGQPPARTALAVQRTFDGEIDGTLHGELGGRARPTEIRDGLTGRLLRAG